MCLLEDSTKDQCSDGTALYRDPGGGYDYTCNKTAQNLYPFTYACRDKYM